MQAWLLLHQGTLGTGWDSQINHHSAHLSPVAAIHPPSLSTFPSVSPHRRLKQFFSFGWGRLSLSSSSTGCCHRLILHTQIYCSDNSAVRQGHCTGFRNVRPQIVNWSQPTCEGHKSRSKLPLWEHQLLKSPYGLVEFVPVFYLPENENYAKPQKSYGSNCI